MAEWTSLLVRSAQLYVQGDSQTAVSDEVYTRLTEAVRTDPVIQDFLSRLLVDAQVPIPGQGENDSTSSSCRSHSSGGMASRSTNGNSSSSGENTSQALTMTSGNSQDARLARGASKVSKLGGSNVTKGGSASSASAAAAAVSGTGTTGYNSGDSSGSPPGSPVAPAIPWPQFCGARPGVDPVIARNAQPEQTVPMVVTSLVIRNIPWCYSQEALLGEWELEGTYTFMHLPYSRHLGRSVGVAIIDFVTAFLASAFRQRWDGRKLSHHPYKKALAIVVASEQGREANLRMVRDDAQVLPAVCVGVKRVSDARVKELVQRAKEGNLVHRI